MRVREVILTALVAYVFGHESLPSSHGMQGIKVFCDTKAKFDFLAQYKDHPDFDFEKIPEDREKPVHVFVPAKQLKQFKTNLANNNIEYEVFVEDLSKLIEQGHTIPEQTRPRRTDGNLIIDHFPRYNEIKHYFRYLTSAHSDVVEWFSLGKSYEGRDIVGVKISTGGENKPALFIDAGIHAREWIAPTTALYAIRQLAENLTNRYLIENVDVYIVPLLNTDGYTFSHLDDRKRLWRKTRSNHSQSDCIGVDGNRNFGYHWMAVGASANPCSDIYAGHVAFSESETRAVRDFILEKNKSVKVYLSLHSYGNYLLHPWGWKKDLPKSEPTLTCVAKKVVDEIEKVRGTRFEYGSSTNTLSSGAGCSDDWALAVGGVELAYTIELGDEKYGFASPSSEIEPVGQEFFEAVKVYIDFIERKICQNLRLEDEYEPEVEKEFTTETVSIDTTVDINVDTTINELEAILNKA